SRRRHTRFSRDWSSDVCSSDLFSAIVLENLRTAGVQQSTKDEKIVFTSLVPWPGEYVAAEGRFMEGEGEGAVERRAAIFIGPELDRKSVVEGRGVDRGRWRRRE